MTQTKTIIGIFALAILIGGGAYIASRPATTEESQYPAIVADTTTTTNIEKESTTGATPKTIVATAPKTTSSTPKTTTIPKVSSYTTAEVAAHSSATSCWTIVNGNVYDVTSWISKHPGGAGAIKGMCGVDASDDFNEQHGGDGGPERVLSGYKIGALK